MKIIVLLFLLVVENFLFLNFIPLKCKDYNQKEEKSGRYLLKKVTVESSNDFVTVGQPIIEVTDINFGNLTVGKKVTKIFMIRNLGTVDLRITGYEGNFFSVYTHNLHKVSAQNPLIIPVNADPVPVEVVFMPNTIGPFKDSIIFISDAGTQIDNIAVISGVGIQPGLIASSYDWGRCRIDRPNFPRGPYNTKWVPGQPQAIKLENNGSEKVQIDRTDIKVIKGDQNAFFIGQSNLMLILEPQRDTIIEVFFQPKTVGEHEIEIEYQNTSGTTVKSVLKGIGVLPRVAAADVDFGGAIIGDTTNPRKRKVRFTCENYQWADTLTITNFITEPKSDVISDYPLFYGTEGFRYIKDTVLTKKSGGKIILSPGKYIEFEAWFAAMHDGNHKAALETMSDAEKEVQSVWYGIGSLKSLYVTGDISKICEGSIDTLTANIVNCSSEDIVISNVSFKNILPDFSFLNPNDMAGFTLKPGDSRNIKIRLHPVSKGKIKAELVFHNESKDDPEAVAEFYVEVSTFERKSVLTPAVQNKSIGEKATVSVRLEGGESIKNAMLDTMIVEIDYDNDFLKPVSVNIGKALQYGKYVSAVGYPKIIESAGKIFMLILSKSDEHFDVTGEVLTVQFNIAKPSGSNTVANIQHLIGTSLNHCVNIVADSQAVININVLGAKDELANTGYTPVIIPNPVGNEGGELCLNNVTGSNADIRIFSSVGEFISVIHKGYLEAGSKKISIDTRGFAQGLYFVRIDTGEGSVSLPFYVVE